MPADVSGRLARAGRLLPGRAERDRRELEAAVPEVLDVLRATIAAGVSPWRALQAAAEAAPTPLVAVLASAVRSTEQGSSAGRALADAGRQAQLSELVLAGEALDLAEATGAPAGRVLAGVTAAATDRVRSRQARLAATAEARLSARVVAGMAPGFLLVLACTAPSDTAFLVRTPTGWATLAVATLLETLGAWWASRIVTGTTAQAPLSWQRASLPGSAEPAPGSSHHPSGSLVPHGRGRSFPSAAGPPFPPAPGRSSPASSGASSPAPSGSAFPVAPGPSLGASSRSSFTVPLGPPLPAAPGSSPPIAPGSSLPIAPGPSSRRSPRPFRRGSEHHRGSGRSSGAAARRPASAKERSMSPGGARTTRRGSLRSRRARPARGAVLAGGAALLLVLAFLAAPAFILVASLAAGCVLLAVRLTRRRRAAEGRAELAAAAPAVIDLLGACLLAGLNPYLALQRVAERTPEALRAELTLVAVELRRGHPPADALRAAADRTGLDELRAAAGVLGAAERWGTPPAEALAARAESFRTRARHEAEEQAGRAAVRLAFPLVFCFLPAFVVTVVKLAL